MHEPFRQWVVEDDFVAGARPDLAAAGVELVEDVTPFEDMKLRCLNGTHSALAYLGYLAGHETIAEAVADPVLARYVRHLWAAEIVPSLEAPPGVDLAAYTDALFARYANPAIRHRTWQIAMDGSQKLPQRILATLAGNRAAGRPSPGLTLAVAAWMRYVGGTDEKGAPIDVRDPLAERLRALSDAAPDPRRRSRPSSDCARSSPTPSPATPASPPISPAPLPPSRPEAPAPPPRRSRHEPRHRHRPARPARLRQRRHPDRARPRRRPPARPRRAARGPGRPRPQARPGRPRGGRAGRQVRPGDRLRHPPDPAGEHVHSHNCAIGAHDQDYRIGADLEAARAAIPAPEPLTFAATGGPTARSAPATTSRSSPP
jgi:hypothetical protein